MWKDVKNDNLLPNYYEINENGMLRRKNDNFIYIYKSNKHKNYIQVRLLNKNGKKQNFLLHRLVAETFIPNPNNYTYINHIDGTRQNNCVENLEWCTQSHNMKEWVKLRKEFRNGKY